MPGAIPHSVYNTLLISRFTINTDFLKSKGLVNDVAKGGVKQMEKKMKTKSNTLYIFSVSRYRHMYINICLLSKLV